MKNNNSPYVVDEKNDDKQDAKKDGHQQEAGASGHLHESGEDHTHEGADGLAHAAPKSAEDWTVQDSMDYYLSPDHLIGHVQDSYHFETLGMDSEGNKNHINIPWISPYTEENPIALISGNSQFLGPSTFQPSKFVILELLGALILCAIFIPYARRIKNGDRPKGRFMNMIDATVCYIRDEIAVPGIGSHDAKRFLPFVWTIFFFVLVLNLLGMIPGLGAATGSISVTAALALAVFVVVLGTGMKKMGVVGFLKAQAPHLDVPIGLKLFLLPMIWAIEVFGLLIKHAVLAVRLFANMFAGHLVVGVFVAFIGVTWGTWMVWGAAPVVILATIAVNLLELLVAFIQAYVFAFLTSLFIGAAIHPH